MQVLSTEEREIIRQAVRNADTWGTGRYTYTKNAIEEAGYKWTDEHEHFLFKFV